MIAKMGYPSETHEVLTEDGYILQMHRIPFGKKSPPVDGVERPAALLVHGLLSSSADYVMGIPEKSLGFPSYQINFLWRVWLNCKFQVTSLPTPGMMCGWATTGATRTAESMRV